MAVLTSNGLVMGAFFVSFVLLWIIVKGVFGLCVFGELVGYCYGRLDTGMEYLVAFRD